MHVSYLYGRVDPSQIFKTPSTDSVRAGNASAPQVQQEHVPENTENNDEFDWEETDEIFRITSQYEKRTVLKRLLTSKKILEDEIRHPKNTTPVLLVSTRPAVVKLMIYYTMF
jgi:hypothetical protein